MLPIRLNFLSTEKQQYLHRAVIVTFTQHLLESIVLCGSICSIIILMGSAVINTHFQNMAINTISINQQNNEQAKKIKNARSIIKSIWSAEQNTINWIPLITELTSAIPSDVVIQRLTINNAQKQITLVGLAKTRESFLIMETNLHSVSFIDDFTIPISNLTQKTDIAFTFPIKMR